MEDSSDSKDDCKKDDDDGDDHLDANHYALWDLNLTLQECSGWWVGDGMW